MDLSCEATQGIQIEAKVCAEYCTTFNNCGECSAQIGCGWSDTIGTHVNDNGVVTPGSCLSTCAYPSGLVTIDATTDAARTCDKCSNIVDPQKLHVREGLRLGTRAQRHGDARSALASGLGTASAFPVPPTIPVT